MWLKDDLARHPSHCTLAYWHAPLYSSGGHAPGTHMRTAWRLPRQAGAELVRSGHGHDHERFAPQDADGRLDAERGLRQFVVGTGGAYLTPMLWPRPPSEVRDNAQTGVPRPAPRGDGYDWRFPAAADPAPRDFPAQQTQDSGSARCH
ncbi:hypothetical protein ACFOLJ_12920 [Rugamonas sp. CCM 8940]|uniref:hypothetical protein n=1 Tax=Rugamonas sp. CCM 8940 TaxID=2765359 RepID=UPI0018F57991|nr:hypothetical protein [Rugamonas sp. CCM 8940]MBJ7308896.1 hypothetical protein [Rugamonas sp. CCM 8940]